jgi:hypothetical protein
MDFLMWRKIKKGMNEVCETWIAYVTKMPSLKMKMLSLSIELRRDLNPSAPNETHRFIKGDVARYNWLHGTKTMQNTQNMAWQDQSTIWK